MCAVTAVVETAVIYVAPVPTSVAWHPGVAENGVPKFHVAELLAAVTTHNELLFAEPVTGVVPLHEVFVPNLFIFVIGSAPMFKVLVIFSLPVNSVPVLSENRQLEMGPVALSA